MLLIIVSYHRNGGYILTLPGKVQRFVLINGSRIIGAFISPDDSSFPSSTSACFANSFCIRYPVPVHVDYQSETHRAPTPSKQQKRTSIIYAWDFSSFFKYKFHFTYHVLKRPLHDFYYELRSFGERRGTTSKTFQVI